MRHVPIAEFKDKLSEVVAAAEAGEEIMITRHGRDVVRLMGVADDRIARQRKAVDDIFAFRQDLQDKGVRISADEIQTWIGEGRRFS